MTYETYHYHMPTNWVVMRKNRLSTNESNQSIKLVSEKILFRPASKVIKKLLDTIFSYI